MGKHLAGLGTMLAGACCCTAWAPTHVQVLKGRLALLAPSVRSGAFSYEEGEGLEVDEARCEALFGEPRVGGRRLPAADPLAFYAQVAANRALLPRLLSQLPGGGVTHGSILEIDDQDQCFRAQLVVGHRVSELWKAPCRLVGMRARRARPPRVASRRRGTRNCTPTALSFAVACRPQATRPMLARLPRVA